MTERLSARTRARTATRRYLRRFGGRATVRRDLKAGVVLGTESVPDGLAAGLLAGVNPVHGLYAYLAGTLGGALATGSVFMTVQTTGAMGVLISDVPQTQDAATSAQALSTLALLSGMVMLGLGLARLGSLVRFIPTAVLVGFVNAVAINIVLGQLGNVTGFDSEAGNRILRAVDTVLHVAELSGPAVTVAAITVLLTLGLERTRLGPLAMLVAVAAASAAAWWIPALDVASISDAAAVPDSLPDLALPALDLVPALLVPALSLALVGLVQGAAISGSMPNPDGAYPDASADFRGQGVANLFAGVAQGMPVGGSMSATALVRDAGAATALANLVAAVVMAATILLAAPVIAATAMPALGALLVIVGVRTLRPATMLMVWRTGITQATVLTLTFVLTLLIPLQYAVLTGVAFAVLLHVTSQSNRIAVVRWVFDEGQVLPREVPPPARLDAGEVVVLVPYGSLFFAAAARLEEQLPAPAAVADDAFVVLRLRGSDDLGATSLGVLTRYAERCRAAGATLLLVGVGERVLEQLRVTGGMRALDEENVFAATDRLGASVGTALAAIEERRRSRPDPDPDITPGG
ncbi:SulP family inorganic anion transporter [Nocardioides dubius]|uniref:SulP family inorganic anion transporter n=1 Tax=Nocardioides dubius TaxID=317019 RepID=A0ABN1TP83_9ACTN